MRMFHTYRSRDRANSFFVHTHTDCTLKKPVCVTIVKRSQRFSAMMWSCGLYSASPRARMQRMRARTSHTHTKRMRTSKRLPHTFQEARQRQLVFVLTVFLEEVRHSGNVRQPYWYHIIAEADRCRKRGGNVEAMNSCAHCLIHNVH